ncbi:tetratricopeptide repeat protein [Desulfoluna spongiiphila]|uniref:Ca-activated chloride channel family protein n=1 Tax=Desulfoluna spongiiphila TaxID=419481 RepID=A0A1G5FY12_9BACT|nr:tetratricopeptide repeat protein [Desulfoluna spongiiphila]SCY44173.1 Ca-activated chloride channel family protein [Desulfoluna spongiiphila]
MTAKKTALLVVSSVTVLLALLALRGTGGSFIGLWLTLDQQGRLLMSRGEYKQAAERFREPMGRGEAYFRDGQFKEAAAAFGQVPSEEGLFNRGNALLMAGKYDAAIASYDGALLARPDWKKAKTNKAIAMARRDSLAPPEGDQGGIGGDQLGADDIVFSDRVEKSGGGREETVEGSAQMSDKELRAIWLRRVQTRPADFLRAKFSYQNSVEGS